MKIYKESGRIDFVKLRFEVDKHMLTMHMNSDIVNAKFFYEVVEAFKKNIQQDDSSAKQKPSKPKK